MKNKFFKSVCVLAIVSLSGNAIAGTPALPLGKKHGSNKAPIEVTSDSLEVMQKDNQATFSGHVVAIQGTVRLTADKMIVYYASAADKKADKPASHKKAKPANADDASATASKAASKENPQGAIKKIDADGNVFLATSEETASGANGVYDVEHQEIHLNGNVVLTRGKNILKGDTLVYNFATGRSVVSSNKAADTKTGTPGKGRVRALFVPDDKDNKKEKTSDQQ